MLFSNASIVTNSLRPCLFARRTLGGANYRAARTGSRAGGRDSREVRGNVALAEIIVLAGGAVLIQAILCPLVGPREAASTRSMAAGIQELRITVTNGCAADVIVMKQGALYATRIPSRRSCFLQRANHPWRFRYRARCAGLRDNGDRAYARQDRWAPRQLQ